MVSDIECDIASAPAVIAGFEDESTDGDSFPEACNFNTLPTKYHK